MMPMPIPYVPIPGCPLPPPPPPPRPQHPTLWPQDTYTRKEVNDKDARTLSEAKAYVDESVEAHLSAAAARTIAATEQAAEQAMESQREAARSSAAATEAANNAARAAADAVADAKRIVESPDGGSSITVTNGGEAILRGGGVRIVFRFTGDAEETTLYRYGDTDWYLLPGATPPTGEDIQAFPTPCAQFGQFEVIYRKEGGTVVEYALQERFNNMSYFIRAHGGGNSGTWRFEGCDSAGVVTRADLRRIARGCNDATALLTALRNLLD